MYIHIVFSLKSVLLGDYKCIYTMYLVLKYVLLGDYKCIYTLLQSVLLGDYKCIYTLYLVLKSVVLGDYKCIYTLYLVLQSVVLGDYKCISGFLIHFEAWAKLAQWWFHWEYILSQLMLLVTIHVHTLYIIKWQ